MGKEGQNVQTPSYKISHGDLMYSIMTIVNYKVVHI